MTSDILNVLKLLQFFDIYSFFWLCSVWWGSHFDLNWWCSMLWLINPVLAITENQVSLGSHRCSSFVNSDFLQSFGPLYTFLDRIGPIFQVCFIYKAPIYTEVISWHFTRWPVLYQLVHYQVIIVYRGPTFLHRHIVTVVRKYFLIRWQKSWSISQLLVVALTDWVSCTKRATL